MRPCLLELLSCPSCGAALDAAALEATAPSSSPAGSAGPAGSSVPEDPPGSAAEPDLQAGTFRCSCGESYPILDGLPSMIPRRHDGKPRPDPRTPQSFGLQWTTYEYGDATWFKDLELRVREMPEILGVAAKDLHGSRVLDAGCGHGALTAAATKLGCTMVGLDMSQGVFRAEARRRDLPPEQAAAVHFVHGDVLRPPFRKESFPFIVSIGVLHHTPDPVGGFRALVERLERGGRIYIQMYRKREAWVGVPNATIRAVTSRLPPRATMALCEAALPLHTAAVKLVARLRGEQSPIGTFSRRERLISLFDNFSPRYQFRYTSRQVLDLFRDAGLRDIREVTLENERRQSVGVVGVRP